MPQSQTFRSTALALCLVLLLVVPSARAQSLDAQQVTTITFNDAVRIALDQNIALRQAENVVASRDISVSRQRMNFYPTLSLSTNGAQRYGRTFSQVEGQIVDQTSRDLSAGLNANVNVFNGFGDIASYEQARRMQEAGNFDLEWQQQTTVFDVMSAYLSLVERHEQILILEENLEAQLRQLDQIREFTNVGTRPVSDLYQQEANVASAELDVLNAQSLYQLAEAGLIQILQLDPFGNYEFAAPSVDEVPIEPEQYQPGELLRSAFDLRSDLAARSLTIDAAEQGIRVARSSVFPSVNLTAGFGSSYSTIRPMSFQDQFFDTNRSGSIGLSLSFPIFDRLTTRNNVQQARVDLANAELAFENTRQGTAVQVRQAYLDYLTVEKRVEVANTQLRAADQALEAEQERYNLGAATLVELSQARVAQVRAASNVVQARYDFVFQQRLIDYYTGRLDPSQSLFE